MTLTHERIKFVELLLWVREQGYPPSPIPPKDLVLDPIQMKIKPFKKITGPRERVLWIPEESGLRKVFRDLELKEVGKTTLATLGSRIGAGGSKSEALMSLINQMRTA